MFYENRLVDFCLKSLSYHFHFLAGTAVAEMQKECIFTRIKGTV